MTLVTITVCVGSSCFLRGAPAVIEGFQNLIEREAPGKVQLKGSFCMEHCTKGVSVKIGDELFSAVQASDVERMFREHVLPVVNRENEV
jgi:NADH:ubiquinone oxidoreductase subunit E